jgi:hypothetical protein
MKKVELTKEEEANELKWKVDDAIESFTRYKKLVEDEKIKEKVIKELKKRADDYKKLASEL